MKKLCIKSVSLFLMLVSSACLSAQSFEGVYVPKDCSCSTCLVFRNDTLCCVTELQGGLVVTFGYVGKYDFRNGRLKINTDDNRIADYSVSETVSELDDKDSIVFEMKGKDFEGELQPLFFMLLKKNDRGENDTLKLNRLPGHSVSFSKHDNIDSFLCTQVELLARVRPWFCQKDSCIFERGHKYTFTNLLSARVFHKPCEWDWLFDYDSVNDEFISVGMGYMGEEEMFEKEDQCRYEKCEDCDYKDKTIVELFETMRQYCKKHRE